MKLKTWAPAVLAVILGGGAAKLARDAMMRPRPSTAPAPKMVQIVVANGNLAVGQEVKSESISLAAITAPTPPPDTFTNPADVVGRVLTSTVLKGQTLLQSNLAARGVAAGISSLVPAGMRAMTIAVDEGNGISGMLLPGCHVDVVATIAAGKESVTRTLVKNVLVQATGQRLTSAKPEEGKEPGPFHTITIIVMPRDAQMIELALTSARMRLLLRGTVHGDSDENEAGSVGINDITGVADKSAVAGPVTDHQPPTTSPSGEQKISTAKRTVEFIRGPGTPAVRIEFDIPRQTTEAGGTPILERVVPGPEEKSDE